MASQNEKECKYKPDLSIWVTRVAKFFEEFGKLIVYFPHLVAECAYENKES